VGVAVAGAAVVVGAGVVTGGGAAVVTGGGGGVVTGGGGGVVTGGGVVVVTGGGVVVVTGGGAVVFAGTGAFVGAGTGAFVGAGVDWRTTGTTMGWVPGTTGIAGRCLAGTAGTLSRWVTPVRVFAMTHLFPGGATLTGDSTDQGCANATAGASGPLAAG
jgi:hypothetical protein